MTWFTTVPNPIDRLAREFWERAVLIAMRDPESEGVDNAVMSADAVVEAWRERFAKEPA